MVDGDGRWDGRKVPTVREHTGFTSIVNNCESLASTVGVWAEITVMDGAGRGVHDMSSREEDSRAEFADGGRAKLHVTFPDLMATEIHYTLDWMSNVQRVTLMMLNFQKQFHMKDSSALFGVASIISISEV